MDKIKKLKRNRVLGIFVGIIGFLVMMIGFVSGDAAVIVIAVGLVICIISAIMWVNITDKLRSMCYECGASLHGCSYEYNEIGRDSNQAGDVFSKVEFIAECPECGQQRVFKQKYQVYREQRVNQANGTISQTARSYNIEHKVRKDAKKYFGH